MCNYRYETIPGYFAHDDPAKLPLPAVPPRFGLNDESENRWTTFLAQIKDLNKAASPGTLYKFFLLSRHGQGYHNLAEAKYGTAAWDDYWSKLNGDGEIVWGPDPKLTPLGIEQARTIHEGWVTEAKFGLPAPLNRYSSPLTRAMLTALIIFNGTYEKYPSRILVKENIREVMGVHTCDKRNTHSYIADAFPSFEIDSCLTEEDELWDPNVRESDTAVAARAKTILDYVFENNHDTIFTSLTAHGGFINGFLNATGRPNFSLATGGVLPLVVKATTE
ncbi:phosphoglycerate mutase-like protein [Crepidotus variabilis]|uniref:Phosphoglycerate mutase-like protein n=1 Tax=Crepidotus variabilis TaxID=179855 RepID=A0A9P6E5Z9_9AGAR|nr:phosphoglycerate mutase-like protein [Crepidotus variabilis]